LKNVYFGEQHIHTSHSPDAFAVGTRGTWDDVYNYAMGKEIKLSTTGQTIKKRTPYDFVGITDHAEYFGVMPALIDPKNPLSKSAFAKKLQDPSAKKAYAGGVAMGNDLPANSGNAKAPTFAVWAIKDPESGNLDRIQIIKSFVNRWGRPGETIYDVALSDNRKAGADGKIAPVGNTVDITKATYTNNIGDSQLSAVWTDPDFDPAQRAAYYVRVLEIPTPRWTTYDSARNNLPLPTDVPATIQERAWSSPIWYTPAN
jgi:hypothetical protein